MASGRLLANIFLMTVLKLFGLFLSLVLIILQTAFFGAGASSDAYFFVRRLILSSLAMIFEASNQLTVPEFVRGLEGGTEALHRVLWRFGAPLVAGMSLLAFIVGLAAHPIITLMAPGFDPERVEQSATLLRIVVICLPLTMIGAIAGSFNFARRQFGLTMFVRLAPRLALIPVFVVLGAAVTPEALSWALVAGTAVMTAAICWSGLNALRTVAAGVARPVRKARTRQRAAAVAINAVAQMAMGWIDAALASLVGVGGVTIMFVAQRLLSAAPGAVNSSVTSAYYTEYSHAAAAGGEKADLQIALAVRISLFLALPLAAFVMVSAPELIDFLLQRGAFQAEDAAATARVLRYLSALLILNAVLAALLPAVLSDDGLPMVRVFLWFSFAALATRIVAGIPLVHLLGLRGVAISIILASLASAMVLAGYLYRRHGSFFRLRDIRAILYMVVAAVVAGVATHLALGHSGLLGVAGLVFSAAAIGTIFLGLCATVRLPEARALGALLRRRGLAG